MRTATRLTGRIVTLLTILLLSCCAPKGGSPEGSRANGIQMAKSPELATAVGDYREGRYAEAYDRSKTLARTASSPLREQAAWVAGLAAYQRQMYDDAELQFMASGRSQDPRLVVDSKIMVGDVRVKQNRWSEAAQCYRDAAAGLSGEERSRVLGYAEVASSYATDRAAGQVGGGSAVGTSAGSSGTSIGGAAPTPATGRAGTAFALQAGAFQSEANARRRASELATQSREAGLGDPRVVRTRDASGRDFWTVQLGRFDTRQGAEQAKARLAATNVIITSVS